jgi:serine phosphatase RsbU (regulator of sigma subunit)
LANSAGLLLTEQALLRAPAAEIGPVLAANLGKHYGASDVELYLVDYRMSMLQPAFATAPVEPLSTSRPGRALLDGELIIDVEGDGHRVFLPMVARGNRVGVLSILLAERPSEELCVELSDLAASVGNAVVVADVLTDTFHRVRRSQRLTLAAEMQWQLLPGRGVTQPEFDLAGQLEPAYRLCGDNFDWSVDSEYLTLTVSNGMGEGVVAALLTNLAINALRNARRSGLSLADQASMADQAVWAQYGGELHISALLMQLELATGRLRVVDAGSPRAWLVRGGAIDALNLEAQLPLGMFAETRYVTQELYVQRGDRLMILSDGVFDAVAADRRYADSALRRALSTSKGLPVGEAVRMVITDLIGFHGSAELADDAVVVSMDWHGRD